MKPLSFHTRLAYNRGSPMSIGFTEKVDIGKPSTKTLFTSTLPFII